MSSAIATVAVGVTALTGVLSDKDPFVQDIYSKVMQTIEQAETVPGLSGPVFGQIKNDIKVDLKVLTEKGVLEVTATDEEVRPRFVALQAIFEHVLSHEQGKSIQSLTGVIHTPMPATPLCTKGELSKDLVAASIEADPQRAFTVSARATILRDYLYQGGDLYVVYPKEGKAERTAEQLKIYEQELGNYPVHLFDRPLTCNSIDTDLVGAFYVFKNQDGKSFAFAIKMTQAKNPKEEGSFGLWFGEVNETPVSDRISKVMDVVNKSTTESINLPN